MSNPPADPRVRRTTTSGIFRRFRRSVIASDLLPDAADRRLGPEGVARPNPTRPSSPDDKPGR
ncbi:hypothetical protein FBQ97_19935 [Acidobacteria bacterium ACD]|nr:MAG: hypothetical protein EDX89_00415 [Acidobacteriota bacterium]MCE7960245.1 hypothetical protein [Acidobacteria bacterium ACB2]MDL1952058.1 hypothetical protein [Acidobacteria bacterium ACD]